MHKYTILNMESLSFSTEMIANTAQCTGT